MKIITSSFRKEYSTTVTEQTIDSYTIEAEVYGKGIVMWLLSQGSNIEVVKLETLRQKMKQTLQDMLARYKM